MSDYLIQLSDAITKVMIDNEVRKCLGQDAEKNHRMTSLMKEVFGLVIDLISNVPYSKLREVKLVNKEKLHRIGYAASDLKDASRWQHEISRMLDQRISELNEALGKMNERLQ